MGIRFSNLRRDLEAAVSEDALTVVLRLVNRELAKARAEMISMSRGEVTAVSPSVTVKLSDGGELVDPDRTVDVAVGDRVTVRWHGGSGSGRRPIVDGVLR